MGIPASKMEKPSEMVDLIEILNNTKHQTPAAYRLLNRQLSGTLKTFAFETDWNEVYENILLSSQEFAISPAALNEVGVTHVLNVAEGTTFAHCKPHSKRYIRSNIVYKGIKASDTFVYNLKQHFEECSKFMDDALSNGGKVVVHCVMGYSRSPAVVAAYLMSRKGISAQQAIRTIRSRREIFPNHGFLQQLCDFEQELRDQGILPILPVVKIGADDNKEQQDAAVVNDMPHGEKVTKSEDRPNLQTKSLPASADKSDKIDKNMVEKAKSSHM